MVKVFLDMPVAEILPIVAVLLIVFGSVVVFMSDKFPIESVAFAVLLVLLVTGLVPENKILTGFSNPATMTIVAMLVLSAGLERTGIIRFLANRLSRIVGKTRLQVSLVLSTTCGVLSAFVSNTATVAVLLPVALRISKECKISPTKILMPLSFAAQFGGVCTLIGTTTNLLVNVFVIEAGLEPLSVFEFAKLGSIYFIVGMAYMLIAGIFLPSRSISDDATSDYRLQDYMTELHVQESSPLIGQTGEKNALIELDENISIIEIVRDGKLIWAPKTTTIREGDKLLIRGDVDLILDAADRFKLEDWAEGHLSETHLKAHDVTLAEVMVSRGSHLIGRSLTQLDFYWRYHAAVLGVRRWGEVINQKRMSDIQFHEGDTLLLQGHKSDLEKLSNESNFMFLQDLSSMRLRKRRAVMALLILATVLTTTAIGMTSILTASLVGVAAMVMTRCLSLQQAYDAVDIKIILLLAGMIPLGLAMQTSGAASFVVDGLMDFLGDDATPYVVLGVIYALTVILTSFMSNAATAVLLAPLAVTVAANLGVDPKPFLMAVAYAASTCFATPVGYQTNTMIYGPGQYRYVDFIFVGLPLNIIFFALSIYFIPQFWPF